MWGIGMESPSLAGLFYWLVLFTIFMYRLLFIGMLPLKQTPSIFVVISPPAVIANRCGSGGGDSLWICVVFLATVTSSYATLVPVDSVDLLFKVLLGVVSPKLTCKPHA